MSREPDNPSSTPPRPGADAYPSGTPPYGAPSDPSFSRAGQPQNQPPQPSEPVAEETRTETTLTTRIRINIPGSRPIPPVVVRSPMPGTDTAGADASQQPDAAPAANRPRHRSESASSPVLGVMESTGGARTPMPDLPPEWRTQDAAAPAASAAPAPAEPEAPSTWFAPRKKGATAPPEQQSAPDPAPAPRPAFEQPAFERPAFERPERSAFESPTFEQPTFQQPVFERPAFEQPAQPQQPGQQRGYFDPPAAPAPAPGPTAAAAPAPAPAPAPVQPQQPFQPVYQQQPYGRPEATTAPTTQAAPQTFAPRPVPGGARPSGMNGGLTVGAPMDGGPDATAPLPLFREPPPAEPSQAPTTPGPARGKPDRKSRPAAPAAETTAPAPPRPSVSVSVSDGFAGGTGGVGAPPRKPPTDGSASADAATTGTAAAPKSRPAARRARKLVVTGIGAVVMVSGVAYGAGLMLNQADVPKGTTVLGQNIGGDTRDAAVHTLDGTVGKLAALPLQLVVGGRTVQLDPSVAGLTIDTTATVQNAANHSYNPVSVIESLRGGNHPVAPVVQIDQDKLRSALQQLVSSDSGGASEGSVHFTADGNVVTVAPRSGQSLDVNAAMGLVQQAYQSRAAGRPDKPITLPVTSAAPKVSADAVTAAADSIGKWAMTSSFYLKIHGISYGFGKKTFSKSLTLLPDAGGTMVPTFDLSKLQSAYGEQFKGITIDHNGTQGPVTPQDIANALTQLLEKPNGDHTITLN